LIYILDNVLAVLPPDLDIITLEQEQEKLKAKAYRVCRNWWVPGTDHAGAILAALGSSCIYID
jgi:hypothetical protein